MRWLKEALCIPKRDIVCEIYIHETADCVRVINFWADIISFNKEDFTRIYFKKHKIATVRKNTGQSYNGSLRVRIRRSSRLNRKVSGWIGGLANNCGVV